MATWDPSVNGLRLGALVEIHSVPEEEIEERNLPRDVNGQLGQLLEFQSFSEQFQVILVDSGTKLEIGTEYVRAVRDYRRPGQGGDEYNFDVLLGPRTVRGALGQEVAHCLAEKGFCAVKVIQPSSELSATHDQLEALEADGNFGRLPQELEEGYLGRGCKAKAWWFDPDDSTGLGDTLVAQNDYTMTGVAQILQPYCEDAVGSAVVDRTPAMVCMSMKDEDEVEYESPNATEKELEEYYSTWCRGVLRMVMFMGPPWEHARNVTLTRKSSTPMQDIEEEYLIAAQAGTLLIMREDTFEYELEEDVDSKPCVWLQAFLLKPTGSLNLEMGELEGDVSLLSKVGDGPPPPPADHVAVCAIGIQGAANMYDHHKEFMAYLAGTDGQLEIPVTRFDYKPYYSDEFDMPNGTTYTKHNGMAEGIDMFDNKAFEISNVEAEAMDPQCRQVLEVGYICLVQIGLHKKWANTHPTHASVSVGCDKQEWQNSMPDVPRSVATNNQLAISANRFNYVFNLKGGSYVCDTACSSSLIAAHLGKINLMERRWDPLEFHLGIGTNITMTVGLMIGSCSAHMLSPGGRCFTFNATANGYNRGDGTAGMILKCGENPDQRICYLRGSQIGQDGRSASLSAPNGPAQEKCIWGAIREARMTPPESTVWECHGTGTSLGDPIEVGAVRKVQIKMPRKEPLMVATSKSNIGHLEGSAAQMAMCKCIMVVIRSKCPPTQHFKTLNPHLDHAMFDAIFCTETNPYLYPQGHCQVSSFGVGGTNGHAIFWGKNESLKNVDWTKKFLKKIQDTPAKIIVDGPNPETWDYEGPDYNSEPGDRFTVTVTKEFDEEVVTYQKIEEEETEVAEYYCISGNFNDWEDDRMLQGEVPGHNYIEVEVPEIGYIDFRFMADGEDHKLMGPEDTECTKKIVPIVGPKKDVEGFWRAKGAPGSQLRIELLILPRGSPMVTWIKIIEEES